MQEETSPKVRDKNQEDINEGRTKTLRQFDHAGRDQSQKARKNTGSEQRIPWQFNIIHG